MEGPKFTSKKINSDDPSFQPFEGELPSDLKEKLLFSEKLCSMMKDPTVRHLISLTATASIVAANDDQFEMAA